ncbi:MAG: Wzz/FepE/Etk N-terminal domain-containing protein [Nitrospirae bacterium]|nr:Wzz/FepE/Etk N-terminal domain-containing protein [Nitrospirota bacterium]
MEQTQELDIKRYLHLILKRRYLFAMTAAFIITAVVIISYFIPPVYEAKTVVSIEKSFLNDVLLKNIGGTQSIDDKATALSTIMKSRTLVLKVISDLGVDLQGKTEAEVEGLIKSTQDKTLITIEFSKSGRKDVDFFTVSFQHRDPRFARDYVNNVVSKYIESNIGSKREESFGANRFLLDQINQHKEKVGKLDAEISVLKRDESIVLYGRYLELQKRRDDLLVQYTEDHPEVIKVQSEIEALKAKYAISQKKLVRASNVINRLTVLERERESSKKIFDELTAAYGKSEVSTQAELQDKAGTFKIVDPAVLPIAPVSPNRFMIMLLGIVGGLAGAAGLIVLLDTFDDSIKNVDAIRSLGVPVLAMIPHIQDPHALIKSRRKDIFLYTLSGLYLVLLGAVIVLEKLGVIAKILHE